MGCRSLAWDEGKEAEMGSCLFKAICKLSPAQAERGCLAIAAQVLIIALSFLPFSPFPPAELQ